MLKIFEVSDCDWSAANSAQEARDAYMDETGFNNDTDPDYLYPLEDVRELTDEEMDTLLFTNEDGFQHTFRQELALQDQTEAQFFASTEY
jgi:hypothetical protein